MRADGICVTWFMKATLGGNNGTVKGACVDFKTCSLYANHNASGDQWMSRGVLHWMTRKAWFALGLLALLLGIIGIPLPLLPTTPLIILAAFAFSKSSPRFERWLVEHKFFGPIIMDWRSNGSIAPRFKVMAVVMMALVFAISVVMSAPGYILVVQGVVLGLAATFVLTRPSHAECG